MDFSFPVTTCDSAGNNRRCFVFICVGAVVNGVMNIQLRISQDLLISERILACEKYCDTSSYPVKWLVRYVFLCPESACF